MLFRNSPAKGRFTQSMRAVFSVPLTREELYVVPYSVGMTMSKTVRPGSLTPTQCTFGASVTVGMGYSSLVPGFRSVCRLDLVLPRAAEGAHPVVRDVLEGGARRHAVVRVAGGRVVDVVADDASPFLHRTPRS